MKERNDGRVRIFNIEGEDVYLDEVIEIVGWFLLHMAVFALSFMFFYWLLGKVGK